MIRPPLPQKLGILCLILLTASSAHGDEGKGKEKNMDNNEPTSEQNNKAPSDNATPDNGSGEKKVCKVSGDKAIKTAIERGFSFPIEPQENSHGTCHNKLDSASVVAAAKDSGDGVTCRVTYFAGRKLQSGWTLGGVVFKQKFEYIEGKKADIGSRNPEFSVKFSAAPGKTAQLRLSRIELYGDNCEEWEKAFRP